MISASARKMHRGGTSTVQSINQSLLALDGAARASLNPSNGAVSQQSDSGVPAAEANMSQAAELGG
jgi:hypothetical protein